MKHCSKCDDLLSLSEFYTKSGTDRLHSHCKACMRESVRVRRLHTKYGNKNIYKGEERSMAVDHDRNTGEVRGLLCQTCNRMLGLAQDSRQILINAAAYLEVSA